jgi:hypothetical protein
MGILQWTPGSSARPIQPIITGNASRDMGVQLVDALAYINSRGGMGPINAAGRISPLMAAYQMSAYEAPAVPGSDIRENVVSQLYAMGLDQGGWLPPGKTLAVNNTGGYELVIPPSVTRHRAGTTTADRMGELIGAVQDVTGMVAAIGDQISGAAIGGAAAAGGAFGGALSGMARSSGYAGIHRTRP